ncbi:MAG: glycosyltransferase family 2 protein [Clostridia bacterium]|nr:glycosyltransferase family 2 protein [Clostridia bacterium]
MFSPPLVSIITPGFNCGRVLHRLLESVLAQTQQNMEFIFVNDGSTDETAEVLERYRPRFAQQGIDMIVLVQENQGAAAALANGLQHASGKYLCWCDADDYYEPTAMEVRTDFLEKHPECICVSGKAYVRSSDDMSVLSMLAPPIDAEVQGSMFMRVLRDDGAYYCCGAHMLRTSAFLQANPSRYLYPSLAGQNIQMLLPVWYKQKVCAIDIPVYNYVLYRDSHSRKPRTKEQMLERYGDFHKIRTETLRRMQIPKRESDEFEQISLLTMHKAFLRIAMQYGDKALLRQERDFLKHHHAYDWVCKKYYLEATNPVYRCLIRIYRRLRMIRKK